MTQEEYDKRHIKKIIVLLLFCLIGAGFCLLTFGISIYGVGGTAFVIIACSLAGYDGTANLPELEEYDDEEEEMEQQS
jgi:hypothetical protein